MIINAFAKALEVIPRTIADNAGLDSVEVMNKLRQKHAQGAGKVAKKGFKILKDEGDYVILFSSKQFLLLLK